jgi:hypothetical protein
MGGKAPEPVGKMSGRGRWTKATNIWIPEVDKSHRVRLSALMSELNVERRAAADGQQNQPPGNDTSLNEPQLDICSRVFSGILLLNQFLRQQIAVAAAQARELLDHELSAERQKGKIEAELNTLLFERRPELVALRRADLGSQRDLRFFRFNNRLNRDAHYRESVLLVVGLILLAFVVESLVNGFLFSQVMANGLIGGAITAGLVSAINILCGFFAGLWGWRLAGHRLIGRKLLGLAALLMLHSVALSWNLLVAHFREVAEIMAASDTFNFDVSKLTAATLAHIDSNGLFGGIASIQSGALLLVGLFIHLLAAKEGWDDAADRYWDYKKFDKRAREARTEFDEALADLRAEIRSGLEEVEAETAEHAAALRSIHNDIRDVLELARQRQQEVRDSEDEWVTAGSQLLKKYREVNAQIRNPGSAPAYFQTYPTAEDYRHRNFGAGLTPTDEAVDERSAVERGIREIAQIADLADSRAQAAEALVAELHRHVTQTLRKLDRRLDLELEAVTDEAQAELDAEAGAESGELPLHPANESKRDEAAA